MEPFSINTVLPSRAQLARKLLFVILAILAVNSIAIYFYWYSQIWWFDMPMHFAGGFFLGLLGCWGIKFIHRHITSLATLAITVIGFVLIVGGGWEAYEYGVQDITHAILANPLDSVSDIFFDLSGGTCALLYLLRKKI